MRSSNNAIRDTARVAFVSTVVWITGCGQPTTALTGVVSLDGQPVSNATLEFFPVSGKGRVSFTTSDAAGRYRVAVFPTALQVVVTATKVDGKEPDPFGQAGQMMDRVVNALPERYGYQETTPLTADPVENKTTTINFELVAQP